jgi:methane monooxygenase PmoA-like
MTGQKEFESWEIMKPICLLLTVVAVAARLAAAAENRVAIERGERGLQIRIDGRAFADYVFRDDKVVRPYFARLIAPNGIQATRNFPPLAGVDATDHDTMHPGLWLAFGDISGTDFWRNKARVEHVEFVEEPSAAGAGGSFAVRNRYLSGQKLICQELCRVRLAAGQYGSWIVIDSEFSGPNEFWFGDQEEMGLGVRVATPLAVKNGGRLTNSDDLSGEKQVWGKQADWCDYSGQIDGQELGILVVPHPANFRRSWFHARDYGFVAANPFGRQAFTKGEKSRVVVAPGESLRLRFAVLVHSGKIDLAQAASEAAALSGPAPK